MTLQEERSSDLGLFDFITTRRSSVSTLVGEINNLLVELKALIVKLEDLAETEMVRGRPKQLL